MCTELFVTMNITIYPLLLSLSLSIYYLFLPLSLSLSLSIFPSLSLSLSLSPSLSLSLSYQDPNCTLSKLNLSHNDFEAASAELLSTALQVKYISLSLPLPPSLLSLPPSFTPLPPSLPLSLSLSGNKYILSYYIPIPFFHSYILSLIAFLSLSPI